MKNLGTEFDWTPQDLLKDDNEQSLIGTGGSDQFEWRVPENGKKGYIEINRDGKSLQSCSFQNERGIFYAINDHFST